MDARIETDDLAAGLYDEVSALSVTDILQRRASNTACSDQDR